MGFFSRLFGKLKRNRNKNLLNEGSTNIKDNSEEKNSFKESLVVDKNSFEGLDSSAIQKKCLELIGVSPELIKSDIVRNKVFDRCYAQTPSKMIEYLKETCTISADKPNDLHLNDNKIPGISESAIFSLANNVLTVHVNDIYKNEIHSLEIIENSEYDKNGLQLSGSLKKIETNLNKNKPVSKILRDYNVTRQKDIDKAIYINNMNKTKCALDLLSQYHDISKIFVELSDDIEKQPLNVYTPPRDIVMQDFDDDVTIVTLSGLDVRKSKINKRVQESSKKYACMQYIKENDLDLYNYIEDMENEIE